MGRRIALWAYALVLSAPFVALGVLNHAYIAHWWQTGTCPGPMDRHGPCGVAQMLFVVFLGGWACVVVVPALVVWALLWSLVFAAVLRLLRPRAS